MNFANSAASEFDIFFWGVAFVCVAIEGGAGFVTYVIVPDLRQAHKARKHGQD